MIANFGKTYSCGELSEYLEDMGQEVCKEHQADIMTFCCTKASACTLCPSYRDDGAMINEKGKSYSCKEAAGYLESPEGQGTCEDRPGLIESWWSTCCPEGKGQREEKEGEQESEHELQEICSLCPSRIDLNTWIKDGAREYSCKDAAAYLKTANGKMTCWESICCSSFTSKKGKRGKAEQEAAMLLEK